MLTPDEALNKIGQSISPLPTETIPLLAAVDRVLAEDLFARIDLPPFPNSAMDGYAVRAQDLSSASREQPIKLVVKKTFRAGEPATDPLRPGEAARIMTGAPIPSGADAVIMREAVEESDVTVLIYQPPAAGDCLRQQGQDVRVGSRLLSRGTVLRPYEISLLASQGFHDIPVIRKPKVALLITGDELVPVGQVRSSGKIWDSNGPALAAALTRRGLTVVHHENVPDNAQAAHRALERAQTTADVIIVSGGVSMGDFDFTRSTLSSAGFQEIFWKVSIKPGLPLLFAAKKSETKDQFLFGLPGNPLSSLVCLEEFVFPALDMMGGRQRAVPSYHLQGEAANDFSKAPQKQQYLFCRALPMETGFHLHIISPQRSDLVAHACQANALAIAPLGVGQIKKGDRLSFRWLA